jgi:hypothetical protein
MGLQGGVAANSAEDSLVFNLEDFPGNHDGELLVEEEGHGFFLGEDVYYVQGLGNRQPFIFGEDCANVVEPSGPMGSGSIYMEAVGQVPGKRPNVGTMAGRVRALMVNQKSRDVLAKVAA